MNTPAKDNEELTIDGETIVQYLSRLQFNAAKWAYMKLHGGLSEEDAAAKLFADRQVKAAKIESLIAAHDKAVERGSKYQLLEDLLEWKRMWENLHTEPFNWYGAIKAMQVMKDPQVSFVTLKAEGDK